LSPSDDDDEPFDAEAYFNPYFGPPEGEDAWLARVASPVADAYLASQQPPPATREVLAAGFTHKDHLAGARGFAGGGLLDVMDPGPVLAGFAADAVEDGLALSDDELVGVLCAARRLTSWSASIELGVVSQLIARRDAHAAATRDSRQADHAADEVAMALTLTCRAADRLVDFAAAVHRLPVVASALAAGRVDVPKAQVFCDELAGLGDVQATGVADVVVADAAEMTTGELRDVLHRAVLAVDPGAARRRRKKAQKDARVECWTESRGTAALAGRDLPPADVLAADQRIDAAARSLKTAGAEGTLEQLRAKVFIALLTSQPLYTLLPGNSPHHDQDNTDGSQHGDDRPDRRSKDEGCGQDGNGHPDRGQDGNGRQHGDSHPGHGSDEEDSPDRDGPDHVGLGAGDGGQARPGPGDDAGQDSNGKAGSGDDAGNAGNSDDEEDDGNGAGGTRRPQPGTGPRGGPGLLARPGGLTGLTGSVNLTVPLSTWLGLAGAPGEAAGYGHLDADTARDLAARLAAQPASQWCITVVRPDGQAAGHGCARAGPGQRAGPGGTGPPGASITAWLTKITIRWLETGSCTHARETPGYRPSNLLRHLIKTRNRTCSAPGCRRTARRCVIAAPDSPPLR
jgi:hypothetical protein